MDTEDPAIVLTRMEARMDNLDRRFDRQDEILIDIRNHAQRTNGRVTKIEHERIAEQAVAEAGVQAERARSEIEATKRHHREWTVGIVVTIVSIVVSALTGVVLSH